MADKTTPKESKCPPQIQTAFPLAGETVTPMDWSGHGVGIGKYQTKGEDLIEPPHPTFEDRIRKLLELHPTAGYSIVNGWLVEEANGCTCGTPGGPYGHEPGCGYEPLTNDPLTVAVYQLVIDYRDSKS